MSRIPAYKSFSQTLNSSIIFPYMTEAEPATCAGSPCFWPTGKVLGGSSTINTLLYARGFKKDYDKWHDMGNYGWDWITVLQYFKKSENNLDPKYAKYIKYHSTGGYQSVQMFPYQDMNVYTVLDAYKELGYSNTDYNGPHPTGVFLVQGTVKDGFRMSTNDAFLTPVRNRKNLVVATGIRATKIIINDETKTAIGVEYAVENDREYKGSVYASKDVVISAGAIESPHLLMLSGIGPQETLQKLGIPVIKDSKVGYNLINHPTSVGVTLNLTDSSTFPASKAEWLAHIDQFVRYHKGPLSSIGLSQLSGYIPSSKATVDYPDLKYGFSFSDASTGAAFLPSSYYNRITIGPYLVRPQSRGYLTINSRNPFDQPLIFPRMLSNPDDRKRLIDGHLFAFKLASAQVFRDKNIFIDTTKERGCENEEFGTEEYFGCVLDHYVGTAHHLAGTCKMGPYKDPDAVVDPELKVHGISNLRVVDVSIVPESPSSNTNAPAIMIAEKASDMIKDAYWRM
ncbi:glucose dehydrogenase [FAD, quinone]-like isoform X2 [Periplaneta americana]